MKSTSGRRPHFTRAERSGLVAEYHHRQLTQEEFAGQYGLGLSTLARWLRQEREGAISSRHQHVAFAEVPVTVGPRWVAEVVRPDGWTVRLAGEVPTALMAQLLCPC